MYILNGCIKIKYVNFLIKHLIVYLRFSNLSTYIYTNIHRYIVSTADCCLPRAFALCRCGDWTLCCCSCWPLTCPGSSSGWTVRNSAPGKLVEQDFRQLDIFRHWFRDPNPSVQFSSVMSNSLWAHGLQHTRPPCSSPTPRVYSNSCLLSRWCHPTISSSIAPFSSCLQYFPASGSFQMSQFFASGGQSVGVLSFSINPPSEYSGLIFFRMDLFDLLAVQGTLKSLLQHHSSKASILQRSAFFYSPTLTSIHDYWFITALFVITR